MIPALIPVSLDNCRMLECTVFLTPCAFKSCNNLLSVWSENARKMKKLQVDINIISQVTGLSPEEIKAL
jgi:hypothetical protein